MRYDARQKIVECHKYAPLKKTRVLSDMAYAL